MKKGKNGAFSLALAGNLLSTVVLYTTIQSSTFLLWSIYAFMLGLCLMFVEQRKQKTAYATSAATLLLGLFLLFRLPEPFFLPLLLMAITVLFIVWPLRFLALGEVASALIFGNFYWNKTFQLCGLPNNQTLSLFSISASVLLLLVTFFQNAAQYKEQEAVQHYSLPVLLGNIFPALDRRWQKKEPSYRWSLTLAFLYTIGCIAFVSLR